MNPLKDNSQYCAVQLKFSKNNASCWKQCKDNASMPKTMFCYASFWKRMVGTGMTWEWRSWAVRCGVVGGGVGEP